MYHMKQATVRDLRYDFRKIERALRAGEEIEITKRGKKIARLVPETQKAPLPDFMARLREMFGDRMLADSTADLISEDREGR
jgi:antitoxin (DNA-binding transcriptional repressor) of toxin-antitoxin stability system